MDYKKHYNLLINRAIFRKIDGYIERHHIIPRCIGGSDEEENIVKLTPEEHFIAHQLLAKIYPQNIGLIFAALMMANRVTNKNYGWIRRDFAKKISKIDRSNWKQKSGISDLHKKNISKSVKESWKDPKRKQKQKLALVGKLLSEDHKNKISESHKGKKLTEEQKQKIREANIGRKYTQESITCTKCGKTGGKSGMRRYHFENCKLL